MPVTTAVTSLNACASGKDGHSNTRLFGDDVKVAGITVCVLTNLVPCLLTVCVDLFR